MKMQKMMDKVDTRSSDIRSTKSIPGAIMSGK